jgi:large subunit ribosomal protein L6
VAGVGYRAQQAGKDLVLQVGFSHPVQMEAPEGITLTAEAQNRILVSGIDKELVGQTAAKIRGVKPPEPYKGKGIKYAEERIRRKVGKTGGKKK